MRKKTNAILGGGGQYLEKQRLWMELYILQLGYIYPL